jgi:Flp pilus assembly protein TadD
MSAAFKRGADLLKPYLVLSDKGSADPKSSEARKKIDEGIRVLTEVTNAQPDNWSAFWLIGKGHQAVGNHAAAEVALKRAHAINPGHPDVAREFMIESVCVGKLEQGVTVAKGVAELHPKDAGLRANLGLAYLASGQLQESRQAIERALVLDPNDPITQALLKEIKAVQSGRAPGRYCPP